MMLVAWSLQLWYTCGMAEIKNADQMFPGTVPMWVYRLLGVIWVVLGVAFCQILL